MHIESWEGNIAVVIAWKVCRRCSKSKLLHILH
jgi:hypothetical protein